MNDGLLDVQRLVASPSSPRVRMTASGMMHSAAATRDCGKKAARAGLRPTLHVCILACAWLAAAADSSAFGQALRCDHLEIAAGGNHSAAQLGVVALDVAPSTGTVYAAAAGARGKQGALLAYRRSEPQLRSLPLRHAPQALADGFAPSELSLMEVGNAVLLVVVANTAPPGGDTLELLRVEDPLGAAGPTGLTLLQTVTLPGVGARITGLWAVWPRGVYIASCGGVDGHPPCAVHHCHGVEPDWRAAEAAASAWRHARYSCSATWPSLGEVDDDAVRASEHWVLHGVIGSPMLRAVYTVRIRGAADGAADGAARGHTGVATAELVGLSREGRTVPGLADVTGATPWHVAAVSDGVDHHATTVTTAVVPPLVRVGKTESTHHKLWVEIATGELLILQSSPSHCTIQAVQAPERPLGPGISLEVRKVAHTAEPCSAAVRLPPSEADASATPPIAIGMARTHKGGALAICTETRVAGGSEHHGRDEL